MKSRQEYRRGRNLRSQPGIGQASRGRAKIENLVEITREGGQFMNRLFLPSHKCKSVARSFPPGLRSGHLPFPAALALALLVAPAPQQLPVNLGDLFQVIFDLVIVLDPTADLF